ncbi:hypothetical protein [Halobaculum rarum]|uniref:hypothetical protein n=1 Tax=Halobaculum rarum TaxID=3075122 RepID=UPI0032AF4A81
MTDKSWHIEGQFRGGDARARDENGQYKSVSVAILEETSEVGSFSSGALAKRLGVNEQIVLEHLGHLETKGLVEEVHGEWRKPNEFDADPQRLERTEEETWEDHDDDSLY